MVRSQIVCDTDYTRKSPFELQTQSFYNSLWLLVFSGRVPVVFSDVTARSGWPRTYSIVTLDCPVYRSLSASKMSTDAPPAQHRAR
jgi:hypothetical protein